MGASRLAACSLLLAWSLPLTGCGRESGAQPFRPVADIQQLMVYVVEPAAEVYWDAVGTVMDQDGTHEIAPTTDEEWEAVVNAAYMVAESGNLMMMQGRARDDRAWMTMSQQLVEVGRRAIAAADARDRAAVFDVGAEVYYACTACHSAYAVETLRPNTLTE